MCTEEFQQYMMNKYGGDKEAFDKIIMELTNNDLELNVDEIEC